MSEEIIIDLICEKIKGNLREIAEINERKKEIDSKTTNHRGTAKSVSESTS